MVPKALVMSYWTPNRQKNKETLPLKATRRWQKVAEEPGTKKNRRTTEEQGNFTKNNPTWQKPEVEFS